MNPELPPPDARVASLASVQHGVAAHHQLGDCGLGDDAIAYRIKSGRLHPVHRGVYAVGHPLLTQRGEWMAAVLAGGSGALLSHVSAAQLWGLLGGRRTPIHVTVGRNGGRRTRGLCFHHPRSLHDEDRATRDRILVTSVERVLLDIAADSRTVERAFEEAIRLDLLDGQALARLLDRSPGRRGARRLRALARDHIHPPDDTRPGIEAEFARFCRARNLPLPAFNALVERRLVDALWVEERLVVELESRAFHNHWEARERDFERYGELQLLGYRVLGVTARRMREDGDRLEATIRRLLAASPQHEAA